jgi:hypothetical protein
MKKNNLAAALIALFAMSALSAGALEIVSAVPMKTAKGKSADFSFFGGVAVKNITFENGAVIMPVTEYKGMTYTDIRILSKPLYKKIEACFLKGTCSSAAQTAAPRVSVVEVKALKSKTRIANVSLAFDGDLSVTFGAIKKASGEIWAAYPANFAVNDDALKNLIEKEVAEGAKTSSVPGKKESSPAAQKK